MSTADGTALIAAARQRARDTRQRAVETVRRLDAAAGETVTFIGGARAARVSRSWLYRQPDLRAEIDRIHTSGSATTATVLAVQRAPTESLRRRLEATLDENARLRTEDHQLRQHVAQRFGQERADGHT